MNDDKYNDKYNTETDTRYESAHKQYNNNDFSFKFITKL